MRLVFKLRGWLMVPLMALATLCTLQETEDERLVFGVGGLVFALGLLLRIWAQIHLHYRLKGPTVLTTTGPYAFLRNPIYVGNTLILAGACMLAELFWLVPVQVVYCGIIYTLVVRYEESHLIEKCGEPYLEYMARVPRWLPRLRVAHAAAQRVRSREFLLGSLLAEAHNLVFLLPFILKEALIG